MSDEAKRRAARHALAQQFAAEVSTWPADKLRRCYAQPETVAAAERREAMESHDCCCLHAAKPLQRMYVCDTCGSKHCAHAADCRATCNMGGGTVQRFVYSRVQCRPAASCERINVGVVLGSFPMSMFEYHDLARPAMLFVLIGVDPMVVYHHVRNVVEPKARALTTEQELRTWSLDSRSLLQVEAPLPVLAESRKQALHIIRDILLPGPAFR